jgi:hypothetical protein
MFSKSCNLEWKVHSTVVKYKPDIGNETRKEEVRKEGRLMQLRLKNVFCAALALAATMNCVPMSAAETLQAPVPVRMTVTASVADNKRMPEISQQDIIVTQGKQRLKVSEWTPAKGNNAGLELFILIDDASDPSLGMHLDDLRAFINAQPSTTSVGVGYMRNATVQIVQNFTTDHTAAAKALRLPLGNAGAYGSPYLSVIDLMNRWPASGNRHEVLMVTDGIDRARRGIPARGLYINPDVDAASNVAMRTGTMIHTIYAPGVGRWRRNYWEATNGQMGIARLSDVTGGESYFLGLQTPVSFSPYLSQLQKVLDNQYLLSFSAQPGKRAQLQNVSVNTEVAGVDLGSADGVWVQAAK